ncbi:MAG TPA: GNAT family protein [Jatrophihabitantaceae bacterium]|jgi:RimJ/RimL family protein N-acetyltransferase|nr:GNAT family protein [Jatrophihabitantaceae bacterium]
MLSGELVTLRTTREADLDVLYEIASELATWEERGPEPPRPLSRPEFAERFTKSLTEPSDEARFAIEVGGEVIGRCDLFHFDAFSRNAELGISLRASARGKGYGTDALRVLVGFAFQRRNLRRVHLIALSSNVGGLACYRKVGFVEEGRRREHAWVRGGYEDEVLMGLLRSEWEPS